MKPNALGVKRRLAATGSRPRVPPRTARCPLQRLVGLPPTDAACPGLTPHAMEFMPAYPQSIWLVASAHGLVCREGERVSTTLRAPSWPWRRSLDATAWASGTPPPWQALPGGVALMRHAPSPSRVVAPRPAGCPPCTPTAAHRPDTVPSAWRLA